MPQNKDMWLGKLANYNIEKAYKKDDKTMKETKMIAFHLPQYHTFPENDEWWGKGFTEWVNVKKAVPLFEGHNQPRVPLNNNYYDLSIIETLQEQMDLAEKYGLYGFCFYHYWFNGKLLLEKPIENLKYLSHKIPYCFCWANEPWTRSWDGNSKDVIMPQYYGAEKEWEQHFKYLLPFFKDDYYIKENGKPFLVIYRTNSVPNCNKMIEYWDKRCVEEGFSGIYIVEEMNSFQKRKYCSNSEAVIEFEPMNSLKNNRTFFEKLRDCTRAKIFNIRHNCNLDLCKYDDIWKVILRQNNRKVTTDKVYSGAFVDWDNTARKGKNGLVIQGAAPDKFGKYLSKQVEQSNSEYLFINAWNEWGEGTYLEPDEKNKYRYLEQIKMISEQGRKK